MFPAAISPPRSQTVNTATLCASARQWCHGLETIPRALLTVLFKGGRNGLTARTRRGRVPLTTGNLSGRSLARSDSVFCNDGDSSSDAGSQSSKLACAPIRSPRRSASAPTGRTAARRSSEGARLKPVRFTHSGERVGGPAGSGSVPRAEPTPRRPLARKSSDRRRRWKATGLRDATSSWCG
jgi:hypothetical protein